MRPARTQQKPSRLASPNPIMKRFRLGRSYTRRQINSVLGGSLQHYLPHVSGKVVCGCFVTRKNPDAPCVILPGRGPSIRRWAEAFAAQKTAVPVFLKERTNAWKYIGDYRVRERTTETSVVRAQEKRSGRKISQVLYLQAS